MSSTTSIVAKVSNFLTGDIVFLLAVFAVLFLVCMYVGKGRFVTLILAFYPATFLYKAFPQIQRLTAPSLFTELLIFLVFLIPIFIIINKYVSHYGEYGTAEGALRTGGFVAALMILLLLFSYTTVSLDPIHNFGSQIDAIFEGSSRIFWWNLAPLALLAFL